MSTTITKSTTTKIMLPMPAHDNLTAADVKAMIQDKLPAIRGAFPSPGRPYIRLTTLTDPETEEVSQWWEIHTDSLEQNLEVQELVALAELHVMGCTQTLPESPSVDLTKVMLSRLRQFISDLEPSSKVWFDRERTRQWFFKAPNQAAVQVLQDKWRVLEQECLGYLGKTGKIVSPAPVPKAAASWSTADFPTIGGVA